MTFDLWNILLRGCMGTGASYVRVEKLLYVVC